jgi:hypothetical protein
VVKLVDTRDLKSLGCNGHVGSSPTVRTTTKEIEMNYNDHPDFNKARTEEESTWQFANQRAEVYAKANADFSAGTGQGLFVFGIGLLFFIVAAVAF